MPEKSTNWAPVVVAGIGLLLYILVIGFGASYVLTNFGMN